MGVVLHLPSWLDLVQGASAVCPTCGLLVKVDGPDHERRYTSHHNPQAVPYVRKQ